MEGQEKIGGVEGVESRVSAKVKCEEKLPPPLQVLYCFARKAREGNVDVVWDEGEEPFLDARVIEEFFEGEREWRLRLLWDKDTNVLTVLFTRSTEGWYSAKRFDVKIDRERAVAAIKAMVEMVVAAVETRAIQLHPTLKEVFAASPEQQLDP
jgi:hypothetical protein